VVEALKDLDCTHENAAIIFGLSGFKKHGGGGGGGGVCPDEEEQSSFSPPPPPPRPSSPHERETRSVDGHGTAGSSSKPSLQQQRALKPLVPSCREHFLFDMHETTFYPNPSDKFHRECWGFLIISRAKVQIISYNLSFKVCTLNPEP
jgi:hypothetical protein